MQPDSTVREEMEKVSVGDKVRWNGRITPKSVIEASRESFTVEGDAGELYQFFRTGAESPSLVAKTSGNKYDLVRFVVVE